MSRINIEIFLGIIFVLLIGGLLIAYGLNEEERMAATERAIRGQAIAVGAGLFENNCSGCHGKQGEGIPGLCPPLNDKHFFTERLDEVGWSGSLEDYIVSTVASGRLQSTRPELYVGQGTPAMPGWSEEFGGPLREDQIRDIAAFVMNWESTAPDRAEEMVIEGPAVGKDITQELPSGDVQNGEALATSQGCVGCHVDTTTGPAWFPSEGEPGIGERAESRFTQSDYTGQAADAEQYMLESIVDPNVYLVEGYQAIMPATYADTLTTQDAADFVAYLLSIK